MFYDYCIPLELTTPLLYVQLKRANSDPRTSKTVASERGGVYFEVTFHWILSCIESCCIRSDCFEKITYYSIVLREDCIIQSLNNMSPKGIE